MNETASRAIFDAQAGALDERLLRARGWTIYSREYPVLDVGFEAQGRTGLRVRILCDNWNDLPPSIQFLSPTGEFLSSGPSDPAGVFNNSPHPSTGRPFICSPGSREYHTHPSHIADLWENYKARGDFDLGGILTKVWRAWRKAQG